MPASIIRIFASLAALAFLGEACTSSSLTGGARSTGGSKKEDSGGSEEKLGKSSSGTDTSTGTEQQTGENDAGDFAFPEDVSGGYLTCQYATGNQGSAQFGCRVYIDGVQDKRIVTGVTNGKLLGAAANAAATIKGALDPLQPGRIVATLTGTGTIPTPKQTEFQLQFDVAFEDGTTTPLKSAFQLFLPEILFVPTACPAGYVGDAKMLGDGRTFRVCTAEKGGGGSIDAMWTRLPSTDVSDYTALLVPELTTGCDPTQKVSANFQACGCEPDPDWIKGSISLPTASSSPFPGKDICLVVETETMIFGKTKTVFSTSH